MYGKNIYKNTYGKNAYHNEVNYHQQKCEQTLSLCRIKNHLNMH